MSVLDQIRRRAAERPRRIVLPESDDARVVEAARLLQNEGIAEPLLLGGDGWTPLKHDGWEQVVAAAEDARAGKDDARQLLEDPLHYAAAIVRAGPADGTVAGAAHTTADTLRAALRILRPAADVKLVSSFFLMELQQPTLAGDTVLAFADSGLVPEPDAAGLAEIAIGTADQFRRLVGAEPRVAMLSFSTHGSAEHASIDRVREATALVRQQAPQLIVDGELQLDAAIIPEVAASKAPGSAVEGRANVLIFPDLNAGNIGYKLVERLAGAQAIGPLLRGLAYPANDLSRGCGVDDIVVAAAITALQVP